MGTTALAGADLAGTGLAGADLAGADLAGASLAEVREVLAFSLFLSDFSGFRSVFAAAFSRDESFALGLVVVAPLVLPISRLLSFERAPTLERLMVFQATTRQTARAPSTMCG
ncbi:MAG: pentapeptide repeat-containing protein [Planctomycetes bacterium]|nr:pentapeptide repeat-containing protein [Planctomycetota bacterium]